MNISFDLSAVTLSDRRRDAVNAAAILLLTGIDAGRVMNQDFIAVKDTFNRAVDEAVEAYDAAQREVFWAANPDKTCPHWYDVMVMGAYNVPAALKEMIKKKNEPRAAILRALLPLHEMLQAAKPLIVKRGEAGPTKRQLEIAAAREGKAMHCQCCGRDIWAETGTIAHHGYQRPGSGWQTASCMGAKYLPFEVSRDRLGDLIASLKDLRARQIAHRKATAAEQHAISQKFTDNSAPRVRYEMMPTIELEFTRATFDAVVDANTGKCFDSYSALVMKQKGFDHILAAELRMQDGEISAVKQQLAWCEERYASWKQTHKWVEKKWEVL